MLTRSHRLTSSRVFAQTIQRGRRAGTRTLVLHLDTPALAAPASAQEDEDASKEVGFVVSKAVGNAVVRNKVKRRLREVARARLTSFPAASILVVRALPASSSASYVELLADFDAAARRVDVRRAGARR